MGGNKIGAHIIGPGITAFILVITLPILSVFYTADDIGRYSMLQLMVSLTVMLFSLGLHQSYVREYFECCNKPALTKVLIVLPSFALTVFSVFLVVTGIDISSILFDTESTLLSVFVFLCMLGGLYTHLTIHILRMEEKIKSYAIMLIMPKLILLISCLCFLFIHDSVDFIHLIISLVLASIASVLISTFLNRNIVLESFYERFDVDLAKKMLKFGSPLVLGGLAFWLLTAMDKFFLKEISTYSELGYYSIAVNFTAIIAVFSTIFMNVWNPILYKWVAKRVPLSDYVEVINLVFIASLTLWALAGVFSWILPIMLPAEFSGVESLFLLLIGGPILKLLSDVTKIGFGIERKSVISIVPVIIAVLVNGTLNYFFIPDFGAKGAAIASLLAFYSLLFFRTELSAWIWQPFPRFKIYATCLFYLIASIIISEYVENTFFRIVIWLFFLSVNFLFNKSLIVKYIKMAKNT